MQVFIFVIRRSNLVMSTAADIPTGPVAKNLNLMTRFLMGYTWEATWPRPLSGWVAMKDTVLCVRMNVYVVYVVHEKPHGTLIIVDLIGSFCYQLN
jgi:hypothetical protein